ncbi:flagellar biosynthesis protein FliR [Legionella massiliensis]|uniref:Flagellar biosynthesis protein FliR n=1 Tax=Legionella massiliensis TaxID=1034943 RepID=A0A078KVQ9_9GAMM|nr:flagellar biosynthetic protein FliR [Legionella massiliensis]CDZ77071.1 flagellar biosynthesis protein FliR [Legionella massiliensis]CEE12809.1 Flagellar biosynthetic protein FliR [Legionella massiliensis]
MINLSLPTLTAIFFVAIRLGAVLLFTPIQAIRQLPIHVRLLLVFSLSILLVSNLSLSVQKHDEATLIAGALVEFANGLTLSMSLYAAFAVLQIAGQLIDTQTGLNSLAILNPSSQSADPFTGRLLTMLAVLFFFSLNCHHWLIQGLAYSFQTIPPGRLALFKGFMLLIQQFSLMFSLALMIASPIVIALLVIEISAAILTRNMPQLSTYFLTLQIKILFGFFLLALLLNYFNPLLERLFRICFQSWRGVMA